MHNSDAVRNNCREYRTEAERLFSEWKQLRGTIEQDTKKGRTSFEINHADGVFVTDGIVCPEQWFSQSVRPLFLLKEAYGGESDWSLTDYIRSDIRVGKIWQRIAGWTRGLLETTTGAIAPYIAHLDRSKPGNEYLNKIAAVNVKKSSGRKKSDLDEICAYANFDRDSLRNQLEICDPTVIVCGYTGSALEIILDSSIRKPRNDNLFYHATLKGHDVIVLDYWHPANQYPDLMNCYGLMAIYQQALANSPDI